MICAPAFEACSMSARLRSTFACTVAPGMVRSCSAATLIDRFNIARSSLYISKIHPGGWQKLRPPRLGLQFAVLEQYVATLHYQLRRPNELALLVHRVVRPGDPLRRPDNVLSGRIKNQHIRVGAGLQCPFPRVQPEDFGRL